MGRSQAADEPAMGRVRGRASGAMRSRVAREVVTQSGIEPAQLDRAWRLPDTLREAGETAMHAVRAWADPRERELRRRRRARRRSLRWSAASGITALGAAGLAVVSAPAWAVIVLGSGAAAMVTGAAVSTRNYLQLRRNPLPQAAFVPRRLPPVRSAARGPIARLVRAEAALHALSGRISQGDRMPAEDLADTVETAASCAAALHALAADIAAMEKTAEVVGEGDSIPGLDLSGQVRVVIARLDSGVIEYEALVAAAGRILAVPESAAVLSETDWALLNLRESADRLDGWAQALTELADSRFRA